MKKNTFVCQVDKECVGTLPDTLKVVNDGARTDVYIKSRNRRVLVCLSKKQTRRLIRRLQESLDV